MDTSNIDNIFVEPKTPRRSIRLKVTASTPLLNASFPSEVILRRSVRKQKTKANKSLYDSNSGKNIQKQAQSTLDNNKKKKQKKGKKFSKNYESKSEESESTENDSDKRLLNVTFDKDSSSNSDCGEMHVLKLSSSGEKSVDHFQEDEKSTSQIQIHSPKNIQEKNKTNSFRDTSNGIGGLASDSNAAINLEEQDPVYADSLEDANKEKFPIKSYLLNCNNLNEVVPALDAVEISDEISSFGYNNAKLGPLADTYGFRNADENPFLNKENDVNAAQQIIFDEKSSSHIVVATDKFDQSSSNKDGNDCSSVNLDVTKEGVNVEMNTTLDLDHSDARLRNIESSKMQIHNNSLTPVLKQAVTITPRSKRLHSVSVKKSLSNRISTPFRRNKSVEKTIGESVVQTLLRSDIVTPVHVLNTGDQFRSISKICFSESAKKKRINRVTFHSPSNVEIPMEDIDEAMQKAKEDKSNQDKANNIYVTERRKRSLSVAETQSERKSLITKLELEPDEECTPAKLEKFPPPGSGGKMPNFNSIHQQKFHKMESVDEHIARKAERANLLTSSTAKYNTGSIIKTMLTKGDVKKQMEPKYLLTNTKKITDEKLLNAVFDKENSRKSDCGEVNILKLSSSRDKSVKYVKEDDKSISQIQIHSPENIQEKNKTNSFSDTSNEIDGLTSDRNAATNLEEQDPVYADSPEDANKEKFPIKSYLLNCNNLNEVVPAMDAVEISDEISSFGYNNAKLGPLADTYGFRNADENTFLNKENDINAAQQIIFDEKSSSHIVVATDKFDQNSSNKDGNGCSSVNLDVTKEGVNVEMNTSLALDHSDTQLRIIESSKMQIHNNCLTPVLNRAVTITPRSKRLQSGNLKDSISKVSLKKSLSNRISTPFRRNKSVEKIIGESVVQTLLRSNIVTPVHVLKTGEQIKSIRKRSFSESAKNKKISRVTFHSPSNVEIPMEDIDEAMEKAKDDKSNQDKANNIYVTERRKRSLSVAETQSERKNLLTKLELEPDEECTPAKLEKLPPAGSRGKMPNFNAIHQQKFHKMESIAEHIARKAERAKLLTSSTAKYNTGSIIKTMLTKDGKKQMEPKNFSTNTKKITSKTLAIPKARQRIELSYVENIDNQKMENSVGHVKSLPKPSILTEHTVNKLKSRQQKNMELYKGRPKINQKTKRQEIVKGVRSNRRFELQMMCRNRSDHN